MSSPDKHDATDLTVAVTGPTGTLGHGLIPLLEADPRIARVVGTARRAFDPAEHGWSKMTYRRGDVRDVDSLTEAFAGADVVVHLAFVIVGGAREVTRAINVEGTRSAFRAAAEAGARRFVYTSSVAAYGFHRDNPAELDEDWPTRPADRLFYAQEKAEVEEMLQEEAAEHPELELYLLRPPIVVGPHTVGGKAHLPAALTGLLPEALTTQVGAVISRGLAGGLAHRLPPVPVPVPDLPLQLVHESDVGRALLQCVVGAGPAGAYNIAAADTISTVDIARELGVTPVVMPGAPAQDLARLVSRIPGLPSAAQWVEALSRPVIMDTSRARDELGWTPQVSALDALREALGRSSGDG
ncbi:NAD-dependent epimerase/dehydratase family protein [Nocardioides pacificus]